MPAWPPTWSSRSSGSSSSRPSTRPVARCEQEWAIDDECARRPSTEGADRPATAEDKLETRRLVDGAKGQLMERSGMSEAEAFGYIQKTAMATRSRMIDVARQVLEDTLAP